MPELVKLVSKTGKDFPVSIAENRDASLTVAFSAPKVDGYTSAVNTVLENVLKDRNPESRFVVENDKNRLDLSVKEAVACLSGLVIFSANIKKIGEDGKASGKPEAFSAEKPEDLP